MVKVAWTCCALLLALLPAGCGRLPTPEQLLRADALLSEPPDPPDPPDPRQRAALAELRQRLIVEYQHEATSSAKFEEWLKSGEYEALERGYQNLFHRHRAGEIGESTLRLSLGWLGHSAAWLADPLSRWVEARPDSWAAHLSRGSHHVAAGLQARGGESALKTPEESFVRMRAHFAAAKKDLIRAIQLEPRVQESYADLIRMARAFGLQDECRKWLNAALRVDPLTYHTRVRYVQCQLPRWGGSYAEMRRVANDAVRLADRNPLLFLLAGWEFEDRADRLWSDGKHEEALEQLDRALAYGPATSWHLDRGRLHGILGRHREAIQDFTEALLYEPWCSSCLWRRASEHAELGDLDAAMRDFDVALALTPRNPELYRQRGWIRDRTGDIAGALDDLRLAAELEPSSEWVWNMLGWIYMKKTHDAAAAQAAYRRLTQLRPDDANAWLHRAQAESMTKEPEFYASLERYLRLVDRSDPQQAETIQQVERLLRERNQGPKPIPSNPAES